MKVLYLRSSFDPGGTESLLLNLFNFKQSRIQFHYALLKDGELIKELSSANNNYYLIFRKKKLDFNVIRQLLVILNSNQISIIHTHQLIELVYALLLKLRKPSLNLFHTVHGYHDKQNKWAEKLEILLIKFTQRSFTVSKASRNILEVRGYPVKKISVLYNAVSLPLKRNDKLIYKLNKRIYIKKDDFIIGMLGNFVREKDQLTIIKAFNLLKNDMPDLKVVFIGKESNWSEECRKLLDKKDIDTRVFFLGPIKNAVAYIVVFDLFVMSTLMDTFGIVVIEALLQKVPVLASDIEVMKELSHNGKYFNLFETQNPHDLANKIMYCKEKWCGDLIKKERAYAYSKTTYSYKSYLNELIYYYSS